jgi:hypothetical protein
MFIVHDHVRRLNDSFDRYSSEVMSMADPRETIQKATQVVSDREVGLQKAKVERRRRLLGRDEKAAEKMFMDIMNEADRLSPEGKFDEEEHIIGNLTGKRPKRYGK